MSPEQLYVFAKEHLKPKVDCTLAQENWKSVDLDPIYVSYLKDFLIFKTAASNESVRIEELKVNLERNAKEMRTRCYDKLFDSLMQELNKNFHLTHKDIVNIHSRLDKTKSDLSFSFDYLIAMRGIIEDFFNREEA